MSSGPIDRVPPDDSVRSPVRVVTMRPLYDTTLAAILVFLSLLFCLTVIIVKSWVDSRGMTRVGIVAMPHSAKLLFMFALYARCHLQWMRS